MSTTADRPDPWARLRDTAAPAPETERGVHVDTPSPLDTAPLHRLVWLYLRTAPKEWMEREFPRAALSEDSPRFFGYRIPLPPSVEELRNRGDRTRMPRGLSRNSRQVRREIRRERRASRGSVRRGIVIGGRRVGKFGVALLSLPTFFILVVIMGLFR